MNLDKTSSFTEVDFALEEAQYLTQKEKIRYSVVQVDGIAGRRFYALPADTVVAVTILETFTP